MNKKSLNKDILKEITKSKTRFLSIMLMIALGSFIFVGMNVTGPTMRNTILTYADTYHLQDLTVSSPLGLEIEDEAILSSITGVELLDYGYQTDVMIPDSDIIIRTESLNKLPGYEILEGRLPKKQGEIALDGLMKEKGYKIGDEISFVRQKLQNSYALKKYKFTIVGLLNSPEYLMPTQKGTASIGDGVIDCFGVILKKDFDLKNFSLARMNFFDVKGLDSYSAEYKKKMKTHIDQVDSAFASRPEIRLKKYQEEGSTEISDAEGEITDAERALIDAKKKLEKARQKLDVGWVDYQSGKLTFTAEISDAKMKLTDGQEELWRSKIQLDDGYAKLADGEKKLRKAKSEFKEAEAKLADAKIQIVDGEKQLAAAQKKIDDGRTELALKTNELNNGLNQVNAGIDQVRAALNQIDSMNIEAAISGIDLQISDLEYQISVKNIELNNLPSTSEFENQKKDLVDQITALEATKASLLIQKAELIKAQNKRPELQAQYDGLVVQKQEIMAAIPQLNEAKIQLDEGQRTLDRETANFNIKKGEYLNGLNKLEDGRSEIAKGETELINARTELVDGQRKYDDGLAKLEDGKKTLSEETAKGETDLRNAYQKILDGESEYNKGRNEYLSKLPNAQIDISEGKTKINKAKKELGRLKVPDYTVHDRYLENGFFQYMENSERMDLLSHVFPVFFFLIALLVSLTTMTRMVDEQRILIGTYKATGYSDRDVVKKYIIYGSSASFVGSILGIILGQKILMPVIFGAYSSNFLFNEGLPKLSPLFSVAAILISLLCTGFVAFLTTRSSLKDNVAMLLRPKTPMKGNRIFLERITPLWRRLSFNYKVTARNIFRYKKRMLMTILGVAGCTALIFMGFGIQDSVVSIAEKQYGQLFQYDTIVIFDDQASVTDIKKYHDALNTDPRIDSFQETRFDKGIISISGALDQSVVIVVPKDEKAFRDLNILRDRKSKRDISLKDGAVITEKIASLLKLKAGDELELKSSDDTIKTIKVSAIAENYTGHYIYMPIHYYEKSFDAVYHPNSDYIKLHNRSNKNISLFSRSMLNQDIVLGTVNSNTASDAIGELEKALNIVVVVMILVSSMLAIVVLYNLTNINVSERLRELSTIMVLGFYPKEVTAYVYRETMILTTIGIAWGFIFGLFLHGYIVSELPPSTVLMDPAVQLTSYLYSAAFTFAFSTFVMFIMHQRLKSIDMVEALKAVE